MILDAHDRGRTVEVAAGNVVTVRLRESPTTGYRWTVERAAGLERVGDTFEARGAVGGAGVRQFQFRAARAGSYEIRMKNWREWEGESSIVDRFDVRIAVK